MPCESFCGTKQNEKQQQQTACGPNIKAAGGRFQTSHNFKWLIETNWVILIKLDLRACKVKTLFLTGKTKELSNYSEFLSEE